MEGSLCIIFWLCFQHLSFPRHLFSNCFSLEKQIEIAARTCYKSENKITEDSAKDMLGKLVNSKHYSMLEHGTVYLKFDQSKVPDTMVSKYYLNPYSSSPFLQVNNNTTYETYLGHMRVKI